MLKKAALIVADLELVDFEFFCYHMGDFKDESSRSWVPMGADEGKALLDELMQQEYIKPYVSPYTGKQLFRPTTKALKLLPDGGICEAAEYR